MGTDIMPEKVPEDFRYDDSYYEALGLPRGILTLENKLRFIHVSKWIAGDSLLDVGAYYGDFIKFAQQEHKLKSVYGTEVCDQRIKLPNERIGKHVVRMGFRRGDLGSFEENSVDTITCMEVLEHVDDLNRAIGELLRVARKRIIITVPWEQKVIYHLCIYCSTYTPESGHLRRFDREIVEHLFDGKVANYTILPIVNKRLLRICQLLHINSPKLIASVDRLCRFNMRGCLWAMIIVDK
ncbi:MAG: class I SAM-dependent methyltransferase [Planctomycetota bacterium]|jgi:ubiquinone/menaquinone biosynthesis C-methylase UbiE